MDAMYGDWVFLPRGASRMFSTIGALNPKRLIQLGHQKQTTVGGGARALEINFLKTD